ncbi:MAG TPA: methionyl-tRNA formyltransferase [Thermomicrobiales bacterium]|nr:methionyl-tRNA formyltransferase [Thermomicrobiales bacterium]
MPMTGGERQQSDQRAPMRVVFFGTPDFATPTLEALAADAQFDVRLVATQPDRPAGRGRKIERSPVARAAERLGLPLYQPASLKTEEARAPLAAADADVFVVAAFGLIFGRRTLALPRRGCVNVHGSLLPNYRGASPVAAAILRGDRESGVTLMAMEPGLDVGPAIATVRVPIAPDDTTATLMVRLANAGARLTREKLPAFLRGEIAPTPQPAAGASLTRPLTKADGWLDFTQPAAELERQVRAMWPWPRAWTTLGDEPLQIHAAAVVAADADAAALAPGAMIVRDGQLLAATGDGWLRLDLLQPAGGRPMRGAAFAAGHGLDGVRLGQAGAPLALPPIVTPLAG